MRAIFVSLCALATIGICVGKAHEKPSPQTVIAPNSLVWQPFLPGVELAVLQGNPKQSGPFTIRIRTHAGTEIPPHWHPAAVNITVLKGVFGIGIGDKFETASIRYLTPGAFVTLPKGLRYFVKSRTASVVQIHGEGPFVNTFVNVERDKTK